MTLEELAAQGYHLCRCSSGQHGDCPALSERAPKRGLWARVRRALGAGDLPNQEAST